MFFISKLKTPSDRSQEPGDSRVQGSLEFKSTAQQEVGARLQSVGLVSIKDLLERKTKLLEPHLRLFRA